MYSFFRKPNHIQFLTIDQDWISKPNHISSETGPMSDFKTSFVQDLISHSVSSILPVPQNGLVLLVASSYCISHVRIIHPRITLVLHPALSSSPPLTSEYSLPPLLPHFNYTPHTPKFIGFTPTSGLWCNSHKIKGSRQQDLSIASPTPASSSKVCCKTKRMEECYEYCCWTWCHKI